MLALYRKYRPATFAEVIGQDHVTEPLRNALQNDRIAHAYLFSGPRGCGKTSCARILARSLNCVRGPTPDPCGSCDSCLALAPNGPGSIDVIEIDAASHGGVDDARELRERAFFAPVTSRFKVYIIDEAHMVTREGFNALLKLVEEPPEHVKFVFATTEPEKVITTIRSRTFHYPFRLVPPAILREHLASVCASEGVRVDPLALALVVRAAAGSVRDALSLLDQLLAGASEQGLTYERASALLGLTDATLLDEIIDAFAAGDGATTFRVVERVLEAGHDPRRFAGDVLTRLRDLLVLQAIPDAITSGLLDSPPDQLDRMRAQVDRFGRAELTRAADIFNTGLTEMRGATSPRLQLELLCARVLLPGAGADEAALASRVDRLERRVAIAPVPTEPATEPGGARRPAEARSPVTPASVQRARAEAPASPADAAAVVAAPDPVEVAPGPAEAAPGPAEAAMGSAKGATGAAKGATSPAEGAPGPAEAVGPAEAPGPAEATLGPIDVAALRRMWPDVLSAVKQRKRTTFALLSMAQVVDLVENTLTISFATAPNARNFDRSVSPDVLHDVLKDMLGVEWQVRTTAGGTVAADPPDVRTLEAESVDQPAPATEEEAVALLERDLGARVIEEVDSHST